MTHRGPRPQNTGQHGTGARALKPNPLPSRVHPLCCPNPTHPLPRPPRRTCESEPLQPSAKSVACAVSAMPSVYPGLCVPSRATPKSLVVTPCTLPSLPYTTWAQRTQQRQRSAPQAVAARHGHFFRAGNTPCSTAVDSAADACLRLRCQSHPTAPIPFPLVLAAGRPFPPLPWHTQHMQRTLLAAKPG